MSKAIFTYLIFIIMSSILTYINVLISFDLFSLTVTDTYIAWSFIFGSCLC